MLKKNRSHNGNLVRYAVPALLTAVICVSTPVMADDSEMIPYTVLNGKYELSLPQNYDVLIKNEEISGETASEHGVTQEQLAAYVALSFDEMIAVSQDEPMQDCDTIRLKVKEDKYPAVGNLKNLSTAERTLWADEMMSGFGESKDYEFYETDSACFIVFEYNLIFPQLRYATVIDDDMIYLYYDAEHTGETNDEIKNKMEKIADTFSFAE